jgi:glycosyltransferase involved in cell wall biosynthesis
VPSGPSFSVIIPSYQMVRTVSESVWSALAQTRPPHEVIVVDDGSTDDTASRLEQFGDTITVLRQDNGGRGSALNAGLKEATGDWIVMLDADDWWDLNRLAAMARLTEVRPEAVVLSTDAWVWRESGERIPWRWSKAYPFCDDVARQPAEILRRNFIYAAAAVRRDRLEQIGGFDPTLRHSEEYDCWLRLIPHGAQAASVPLPLAWYRMTGQNKSKNRLTMLQTRIVLFERTIGRLGDDPLADVARRRLEKARRGLEITQVRDELASGGPGHRRRAWALVRDHRVAPRIRRQAVASAVLPTSVRRRLPWFDNPA